MRSVLVCAAWAVLALPCLAEQAPPVYVAPTGAGQGDGTILSELLKQLQEKQTIRANEGIGVVSPGQAALCAVCSQPLYKHDEPGFLCVPPDKKLLVIKTRPAQCPVCQARFEGALPGNVNDRAGRDRDFCAHSVGKYSVQCGVWVCPECGYAGLIPMDPQGTGFELGLDGKPLDQATKDFVRQKLSEPMRKRMIRQAALKEENPPPELLQFSKYVLQTQIPDWIKYDHVLQLYERIRPPHTLMARLYLEAAHACRREVCSEISAPYLDELLMESLGKAINRINRYVRAECLVLRRQRGDPLVDPNKAETDPRLLSQGVARIIQVTRDAVAQHKPVVEGAQQAVLTNADMFVLHLIHAGILDRLGHADEAGKALATALSYVPERPAVPLENKTLEDRIVRQLRLLRGIVEERQTCLRREQDYLLRAARRNMAAIHQDEIKFRDCKRFDPKTAAGKDWDAAPTAYLLGELLRRAGDSNGAAAWFAAADRILDLSLEAVEKAEKASPPVESAPAVAPGNEPPASPFVRERERLLVLKLWTQEQSALVKGAKQPDPGVAAVIEQVSQAVGLTPVAPPREKTVQPPEPEKGAVPEPAAAPGPGAARTREQLYGLYYAAITRYRKDRQENPPALFDLVKAGYVKAEDANLDANGRLTCPETKERLGYMRNWEPGDKTAPVLFPIKPGSKTLYADGKVREGLVGRD